MPAEHAANHAAANAAPALSHTFAEQLPEMTVPVAGTDFPDARLVVLNEPLAAELGLDAAWLRSAAGVAWLSGASGGHATAYAGHQFGQFVPLLGDGRALLLGDTEDACGRRREIQLKGSGPTPFSRPGSDGFGAIGPMLREYLVSEFMHAAGVPTTRSLAVIDTGRTVVRQHGPVPGGIVARVALSHLRVGSVQYAALRSPQLVADVVAAAGYPSAGLLLDSVLSKQLNLVAQWTRLGFVHGVMNTDNVALSGETLDYGPCAFTESRDPEAVYSSIDTYGRYRFGNQPTIAAWNVGRLAEALLPVLELEEAQRIVSTAEDRWEAAWEKAGVAKQSPVFLPRNHMLERAIEAAERGGEYGPYFALLAAVSDPFNPDAGTAEMARPEGDEPFVTFCGT